MEDTDDDPSLRQRRRRRQRDRSPPSSSSFWLTWLVLASAELFGGFTFSLISPFYTKEADAKGLSVSQAGLVYSSVFLTTLVCTPICGKVMGRHVGCKTLFLSGVMLSGVANVLFGQLQWIDDSSWFLALSLVVRMFSAVGETALFAAAFPLAVQSTSSSRRSMALSSLETMYGIGLALGPLLGGFLYELDGFYLPFAVCGSSTCVVGLLGCLYLPRTQHKKVESKKDSGGGPVVALPSPSLGYKSLLRRPSVLYCCLVLVISGISASWCLPSLQPFLEEKFELGTMMTGVVFMLDGAAYAIFSPFWGWLLDRKMSPVLAMLCGNVCLLLGYCLLGPAPFLQDALPDSAWVVAVGMTVHGFGLAANFITTLTFLVSHATDATHRLARRCNNNNASSSSRLLHRKSSDDDGSPSSAADPESLELARGLATTIWLMQECVGSYVGAACGGIAYDAIGFERGTMVVVGMQMTALITLPFFKCMLAKSKRRDSRRKDGEVDATTPLLLA